MNVGAVTNALSMAFAMAWEILWPLILGFALSGVVQAVVSRALAAVLVWRFMRTGGPEMLRMMNAPSGEHHAGHAHS
jgi:hypothetical protein